MADKIKMDSPFKERTKVTVGNRRYGCVPISFSERTIDLDKATPEEVAAAASGVNLNAGEAVSQNRDSNFYDSIYFIGPQDGFPLKIGVSHCPWNRLSTLQVGNWVKLSRHGTLWTGDFATKIEREAHRLAKKSGILERGEWIWATLATAVDLVLEAAKNVNADLMTPAMILHNQGMAMLARDKAIFAADKRFHELDMPLVYRAA